MEEKKTERTIHGSTPTLTNVELTVSKNQKVLIVQILIIFLLKHATYLVQNLLSFAILLKNGENASQKCCDNGIIYMLFTETFILVRLRVHKSGNLLFLKGLTIQ